MIKDLKLLADTLTATTHTESLEWKTGGIVNREWAWCDALFMGPPPLADLAKVTGEIKYMDLCNKLWWKTTAYLYNPDQHLYFRDGSFLNKKEKNDEPVMWSRGNGWVMSGLAEVISYMPANYPERNKWVSLFKEMSNKIASLQQADGTWHASLLDPSSLHRQIMMFKAWLRGIHHHCSRLHSYIDEFCYRFNRLKYPDSMFHNLV